MKQVLIITALVAGMAASANGQEATGKKTAQERTEMQTQWMSKNLSLTKEQSTRAHDVILKYAMKRDSITSGKPEPSKHSAMRQLMQQREAELKTVLSADQLAKFTAHQQEMRKRKDDRKGNADKH